LISELSPALAQSFAEIHRRTVGDWFLKDPNIRGDEWVTHTKLEDAGLISLRDCVIHQPDPSEGLWRFGEAPVYLLAEMVGQTGIKIPIYNLTNAGLELGSLLPNKPDHGATLRIVATKIQSHAVWIRLINNNWAEELWPVVAPQ